ncbi:hypothetical protein DPMN_178177 [Dreissena polymorpha]|uniref:Uncharacterized protein n=1 Tax=Dreissena polymorpha TaxID=45954 RepID=A0A9D4EEI0_DREPO|nr:hypothetical protein DPMN_178177 [Dreissena polymorpha]
MYIDCITVPNHRMYIEGNEWQITLSQSLSNTSHTMICVRSVVTTNPLHWEIPNFCERIHVHVTTLAAVGSAP